ncbi:MAG TPA: PIN domain-containing protein [Candidatus Acidoferrales bacterium]|nr:PIN domain-containing protein [Candidatus Acidoferrales bacterium]
MNRTSTQYSRTSSSNPPETPQTKSVQLSRSDSLGVGSFWDMLAIRAIFAVVCVAAGYHFRPFSLSHLLGALTGLGFAVAVIFFEIRLRRASLRRLIGAVIGSILGILGAFLTTLVLAHTTMPESTRSFVSLAIFLIMAYIGLILGANKGDMLNLQAFGGLFGSERGSRHSYKVLDTSVIIDGRVADIAEAHFIDGTIIIPQFVLRELQMVADSADPLRRQRGRRGLEVLQRVQKMPHLDVQIADDDFQNIAEVDLKLIELAKRYDAKIITNDFNLNKVATLQGIEILNVNQLANALKPVVLPGETMRVFILREGKEYTQGIAYLDDGTMVVVDGARKMINKTIDISVTSVHQTTAGKMIFGRFDDRGEAASRQTSASTAVDATIRPVPESRAPEQAPSAVPPAAAERPPR